MNRSQAAKLVSRTSDNFAQLLYRAGLPCGGDFTKTPGRVFGTVLHDLVRGIGVSAESARALLRFVGRMTTEELEQIIEREERRYLLCCGREVMASFLPFEAIQVANDQRGELVRRAGLTLTAIDVREAFLAVKEKLAEQVEQSKSV